MNIDYSAPSTQFFSDLELDLDLAEPVPTPLIEIMDFSFYYGRTQALCDVTMNIPRLRVTALIGPSGCGKTTLLESINRINNVIPGGRYSGDIRISGRSLFDRKINLINVRRIIGMVFQKPNPFPCSIYENVAYGVRLAGERSRSVLDEIVEKSLIRSALWNEVKDRLRQSAFSLSGGQMQRLCIARAIACKPQVLLMDEPCSSLDPIATSRIEELISDLKRNYTIVLVTHSMQQAARCSEYLGFFQNGRLIEFGATPEIFCKPTQAKTREYIKGRIV